MTKKLKRRKLEIAVPRLRKICFIAKNTIKKAIGYNY